MNLDFQTLYLIILLNSLVLCVTWSGFVWTHRNISGAGYWFAGCLSTTMGGILFAIEPTTYGHLSIVAANSFTVFGFCLAWAGIRRFRGQLVDWRSILVIVLAGAGVLAAVGGNRPAINVVIAAIQLIPMVLATIALAAFRRPSLGTIAATSGFVVALMGQGTEMVLNVLRLTGSLSTEAYYEVAALLLVAAIFGATIWNLGFVLMAVDRLASDLNRLASFDELTELPNRRNFMETAHCMRADAERVGAGYGVMMIDIDRFKTINDTYGHAAGDACLQHFSTIAGQFVRPDRFLGRLAGDEFGIALVVRDPVAARSFAEQFARTVAASRFRWQGEIIQISISVGVALRSAGNGDMLKDIIEEADVALYETKRRGRNGFTMAPGATARKGSWTAPVPVTAKAARRA